MTPIRQIHVCLTLEEGGKKVYEISVRRDNRASATIRWKTPRDLAENLVRLASEIRVMA